MWWAIGYGVIFLALRIYVYNRQWDQHENDTGQFMLITDVVTLFWPSLLIMVPLAFILDRWDKKKSEAKDKKTTIQNQFLRSLAKLDIGNRHKWGL